MIPVTMTATRFLNTRAALTIFGTLTGIDPWSFGGNEQAAADLGIPARDAIKLQQVASDQLTASGIALVRLPCLHANPNSNGGAKGCGGGKK